MSVDTSDDIKLEGRLKGVLAVALVGLACSRRLVNLPQFGIDGWLYMLVSYAVFEQDGALTYNATFRPMRPAKPAYDSFIDPEATVL